MLMASRIFRTLTCSGLSLIMSDSSYLCSLSLVFSPTIYQSPFPSYIFLQCQLFSNYFCVECDTWGSPAYILSTLYLSNTHLHKNLTQFHSFFFYLHILQQPFHLKRIAFLFYHTLVMGWATALTTLHQLHRFAYTDLPKHQWQHIRTSGVASHQSLIDSHYKISQNKFITEYYVIILFSI